MKMMSCKMKTRGWKIMLPLMGILCADVAAASTVVAEKRGSGDYCSFDYKIYKSQNGICDIYRVIVTKVYPYGCSIGFPDYIAPSDWHPDWDWSQFTTYEEFGESYGVYPLAIDTFASGALDNCSGVTSITLPPYLSSDEGREYLLGPYWESNLHYGIPDGLFEKCESLKAFEDNGNDLLSGVYGGDARYRAVNGLLYDFNAKKLFQVPAALSEVAIDEFATGIASGAFKYCKNLELVTVPVTVSSISENAFDSAHSPEKIRFLGTPPSGLSKAGLAYDVVVCYNVEYEKEWLPVIAECGFVNVSPFALPKQDGGPYKDTVDEVEWTFIVKSGEASIGKGSESAVTNTIAGAVEIPSVLGGRPVVTIDDCAFNQCSNITSVTIPASVKTIGTSAFEGCDKLANVYFEGETLSSIGVDAFKGCNWDLIMHVPADWQGRGRTLCGYSVWRAGSSDLADANQFAIVFCPGTATGTMPRQTVTCGTVTALSNCTFTPPSNGRFTGWQCSNGKRYDDGVLVFNLAQPGETVTMTAIWDLTK